MQSDSGGAAGGTGRRRAKGKASTIDLTAKEVHKAPDAAEADSQRDVAGSPAAPAGADVRPDHDLPQEPPPSPADDATLFADGQPDTPMEKPTPADAEAYAVGDSSEPDRIPEATAEPGVESNADADTASEAAPSAGLEPIAAADGPPEEDRPGETDRQAEPPPPFAARPASEPDRRPSAMGSLAAAAVGGLIVLAGGAALVASGVVPLGGDTATADRVVALESGIADIDRRLAEITTGGDDTGAALATRVDALEASQQASTGDEGLAAAIQDLGARVDALAAAPPAAGGADPAVEERLASIAADLDLLRGRLDTVDTANAEQRIGAVEDAVAELRAASGPMDETLSRLDADLAGLAEAAEAREAGLTEIVSRLGAIEERLDAGPTGGEIAALSLAVTTLASKVSAGEPFAADLEVVRTAAPDLEGLDVLAATAETGVPTTDDLASTFPAEEILATRVPPLDAGVVDRLFAGAKSLVNYRETGAGADDPTAAAVSAIETALAVGDLAAARAAVDDLPEAARLAAESWIADLDRRIAADTVVADLTDRILTRLQAPAEGQ